MKCSSALGLGQRRERRHFQCCLCSLSSAPSCLAVHWYLVHGAQLSGSSNLPQLGRGTEVAQLLGSRRRSCSHIRLCEHEAGSWHSSLCRGQTGCESSICSTDSHADVVLETC